MAITRISSHTSLSPSIESKSIESFKTSPVKSSVTGRLSSLAKSLPGTMRQGTRFTKISQMQGTLENTLRKYGKSENQIKEIIENNHPEKTTVPLTFTFFEKEAQGRRPSMEDAHFISETRDALIFGVCDGHADDGKIAKLCAKRIPDELLALIKEEDGNVTKAAQRLIDSIHSQVINNKMSGGSTIVFCYLDKKTNLMTSVTLGDSEARVYRKTSSGIVDIPLCDVLDWTSEGEAKRAAEALNIPEIAHIWPKVTKEFAKLLRAPPLIGPNLTRAVGDQEYQDWLKDKTKKIIIQDALFQQFYVLPGDKIVVACDGLWDVEEKLLPEAVMAPNWNKSSINLAEKTVDFALKTRESTDNVSVIVVNAALKSKG